jgi:peptidyl-dipeptidase Dcp
MKEASVNAADRDVKQVQEFAKSQGAPMPLMPWDFAFWSERLKEKLFQFNAEDLRPYFQLEKVIAGVFEHARRLYGLVFKESKAYPTYHPDVKTYEVYTEDTQQYIGIFYADFFPRETKNGGAWMTNFYEQGYFRGQVHRPHVAIVCNFTKPTPDRPSLLTFDEVQTIFHEFGHSLHSLLSQCQYRSLSGTNVYWDFVELPSQIMENWTLEKESLDLFAEHYKTGEKIPIELTKKIKDSANFMSGYISLRQVTFAWLDMAWHTTPSGNVRDIEQFEDSIVDKMRVLPKIPNTNFSCSFTHVFAGGYSAGYYSYKWAEVLDADAFELFLEKGLFDRATAKSFKENILSRGGTEHPMELYKRFRGREPDPQALLKREGLI